MSEQVADETEQNPFPPAPPVLFTPEGFAELKRPAILNHVRTHRVLNALDGRR